MVPDAGMGAIGNDSVSSSAGCHPDPFDKPSLSAIEGDQAKARGEGSAARFKAFSAQDEHVSKSVPNTVMPDIFNRASIPCSFRMYPRD